MYEFSMVETVGLGPNRTLAAICTNGRYGPFFPKKRITALTTIPDRF